MSLFQSHFQVTQSAPAAVLTAQTFAAAVDALTAQDDVLAATVARFGPPPFWQREPGFGTLLHIILEQQVSLASAKAAYDRLCAAVDPLTPAGVLALDDDELRRIGFSRQKTAYARTLAAALADGVLDLDHLPALDDDTVFARLTALKGIGPWTANVYLLMALRRPDIWPTGDLALALGWQRVAALETRPSQQELAELAARWQPWRAVAARIVWHGYLSGA